VKSQQGGHDVYAARVEAAEASRAVTAAMAIAASLDLRVENAIVLHNSNKLTVRLLPGDVVARVAPAAFQVARFEVEIARRLAGSGWLGAEWLGQIRAALDRQGERK
jgi:hypothetical protein